MSHDTVYKNEEMIKRLDPDVKRRVMLMAGQIEVADREFDRLNMELSAQAVVSPIARAGATLLHRGVLIGPGISEPGGMLVFGRI